MNPGPNRGQHPILKIEMDKPWRGIERREVTHGEYACNSTQHIARIHKRRARATGLTLRPSTDKARFCVESLQGCYLIDSPCDVLLIALDMQPNKFSSFQQWTY